MPTHVTHLVTLNYRGVALNCYHHRLRHAADQWVSRFNATLSDTQTRTPLPSEPPNATPALPASATTAAMPTRPPAHQPPHTPVPALPDRHVLLAKPRRDPTGRRLSP
jgi:hypothetical protein